MFYRRKWSEGRHQILDSNPLWSCTGAQHKDIKYAIKERAWGEEIKASDVLQKWSLECKTNEGWHQIEDSNPLLPEIFGHCKEKRFVCKQSTPCGSARRKCAPSVRRAWLKSQTLKQLRYRLRKLKAQKLDLHFSWNFAYRLVRASQAQLSRRS